VNAQPPISHPIESSNNEHDFDMVNTTTDIPFRHRLHKVWHELQKSSLLHNFQRVALLVPEKKTRLRMHNSSAQLLLTWNDLGSTTVHGPYMMDD
jgi:hypothetical protein